MLALNQYVTLLSLLGNFFSLIAAIYIFLLNRRSKMNVLIAAMILLSSTWAGTMLLAVKTGNFFIAKLPISLGILIAPTLILFLLNFSGIKLIKTRIWLLLAPPLVLFPLSLWGKLAFADLSVAHGVLETSQPGPLMKVLSVYHPLFLLLAIYFIWRAYKISSNIKRAQLVFIVISLVVCYGVAITVGIVAPALGIYQYGILGPFMVMFFSGSMLYVATKHHILEGRVIFSEIWAFLLILIVLSSFWANHNALNLVILALGVGIDVLLVSSVLSESRKTKELLAQNIQLTKAKKDLETLDQMKDEFIKMSTHELNTPISIIKNILSIILDSKTSVFTREQKAELAPVYDAADRLGRLAKSIFEAAFIENGGIWIKKHETDIPELINKAMIANKESAAAKKIKLVYENKDDKLPLISVDQDKMYEVVSHLIENAIKFTPKGEVQVGSRLTRDSLIIKVRDSGIGITTEEQKKLFVKFYQSGRFDPVSPLEQQGVGLGLYISKNIVALHGGKITVESTKGKGSTFSIILPLGSKAEPAPKEKKDPQRVQP